MLILSCRLFMLFRTPLLGFWEMWRVVGLVRKAELEVTGEVRDK